MYVDLNMYVTLIRTSHWSWSITGHCTINIILKILLQLKPPSFPLSLLNVIGTTHSCQPLPTPWTIFYMWVLVLFVVVHVHEDAGNDCDTHSWCHTIPLIYRWCWLVEKYSSVPSKSRKEDRERRGIAFNTIVKPRGYPQCILVSNAECNPYLFGSHEQTKAIVNIKTYRMQDHIPGSTVLCFLCNTILLPPVLLSVNFIPPLVNGCKQSVVWSHVLLHFPVIS